ncbi:PREDICTED: mas-related G-protein coupled receptor member G [Lipotes vexillifer]|uniref:Mas-related G-protein coupled receptor member G n=1 Tax=Lipotes vexillifer TaxID=118797 RepID=A0A340Y364_LIPVE|nr:PREDICTED: mas-related G-protein coupled receptor member G [Lipotes vexillifer]
MSCKLPDQIHTGGNRAERRSRGSGFPETTIKAPDHTAPLPLPPRPDSASLSGGPRWRTPSAGEVRPGLELHLSSCAGTPPAFPGGDNNGSVCGLPPGSFPPATEPASVFGLWRTFTSVVFYLTLAVGLGGLVGNGLVLWHLGFHIKKGPFSVYILHVATAEFLFLGCQLGFSAVQAALGSKDSLYLPGTFAAFSAGLWLLAALSAERCLSDIFPACYQGCHARHTSGVVCGLIWALTPPAVLLPANACGLPCKGMRLSACRRYHVASITWLLSLACVACVAGLALFVWVTCCSQRPRPQFYGLCLGSVFLLLFCGLPYIPYWTPHPILNLVLPVLLPLASLLACVHCSARPLIYFATGQKPGKREPLRVVLQRALGEGAQLGAGGLSLPMGCMSGLARVPLTLHQTLQGHVSSRPPRPQLTGPGDPRAGSIMRAVVLTPTCPACGVQGRPEDKARDTAGKRGAPRTGVRMGTPAPASFPPCHQLRAGVEGRRPPKAHVGSWAGPVLAEAVL